MKKHLLISTLACMSMAATAAPPQTVTAEFSSSSFIDGSALRPSAMFGGGFTARALAKVPVRAAALTVPYLAEFTTPDISGFTIIDADNDNFTWAFDPDNHCMKSGGTKSGLVDKDDWLITPGLTLEKGKVYTFSLDLWRRSASYEEKAEICMGSEPTAEAMTTVLMDKSLVLPTNPENKEFTVTVPATGTYYFGIHACSVPLRWTIYVDNIKVDCTSAEASPAAVSDFAAVADIHGADKVVLTLTAPDKAFDGSAISSLVNVELSRDGQLIKTFNAPAPGEKLEFTDTQLAVGSHVYSVEATGVAGKSLPASAEVYVGFTFPKAPSKAYIKEDATTPGKVVVTWDAVTEDINGKIYPAGTVLYNIADASNYVARNISGTSAEFYPVPAGQDFAYYGVFTSTNLYGGSETYANTGMIPVGTPYTIPFYESAGNNGDLSYNWGVKNWSEGSTWGILDYASSDNTIAAFDGDDAYMASFCQKSGDSTRLISGKIDVTAAKNPYIRFAYWGWEQESKAGTIIVMAREAGSEEEFKTVATYSTTTGPGNGGWQRVFIPIDEFKGKIIQIAIETVMGTHYYTMFDAITVYNVHDHDIGITRISAPSRVKVGEEHSVTVEIEGRGVNTESSYTIDLLLNGEVVQTVAGEPIALGEYRTYTIANTLGVNNPTQCEYSVRVNVSGDGNEDDNLSEPAITFLTLPNYPTVPDLVAEASDEAVVLTWSAPDTSNPKPEATFDSFEDYEDFAIANVGEWTIVDLDGEDNYTLEDNEFPHNGEALGYIVVNTRKMQTPFAANSGNKAMVSFASTKNTNNDWLITPELWAGEQEISFYAKSHIGLYGLESFDALYSTESTSPYDFTRIGGDAEVPTVWTRYSYTVPVGTKYFAVRCTSKNMLAFMVDDFEFMAASTPLPDLTFVGYNVYRDMHKLNAEPLTSTTFTDTSVPDGSHTYQVSAIYAAGESRLSDPCEVGNASAIGKISGTSITATGARGFISIRGAEGLPVAAYSISGTLLKSTVGQAALSIPAQAGVYIVKVGEQAFKVVVK